MSGRWYITKSKTDHHMTPQRVVDYLLDEYNIDWDMYFDPCPYHSKFDGLKISWKKKNAVNPPYLLLGEFVTKALIQRKMNKITYFLYPLSRSDKWYFQLLTRFKIIYFPFRLKFEGSKDPAFQTHCLVIIK